MVLFNKKIIYKISAIILLSGFGLINIIPVTQAVFTAPAVDLKEAQEAADKRFEEKYIPYNENLIPENFKSGKYISKPIEGVCSVGITNKEVFGYKLPPLFGTKKIQLPEQRLDSVYVDGKEMKVCVINESDRDAVLTGLKAAVDETKRLTLEWGNFKLPGVESITQTVEPYRLTVSIPCQPFAGGQCPTDYANNPAAYIARLYQFGLMIAGLAAFGSIIYGALKYTLSAGNVGSTEDAKDQITQALLGLLLLLGVYLILYTINPDLVNLQNPEVEPINVGRIISDSKVDQGSEQLAGAREEHPFCRSGTYTGISQTGNIKVGIGGIGLNANDFICYACKPNATKVNGKCECDKDFSPIINANSSYCQYKGEIREGVTAPEFLPPPPSPSPPPSTPPPSTELKPGEGVLLP